MTASVTGGKSRRTSPRKPPFPARNVHLKACPGRWHIPALLCAFTPIVSIRRGKYFYGNTPREMDFMVIYSALALNDGKPQLYFDHPAYLTILSVKFWFQLLHGLGLLDAWSLSSIPPASNAAAFDAAMTSAVRAGRLLAFLTATGCV